MTIVDTLVINNEIKLHLPQGDILKNEVLSILRGEVYPVINLLNAIKDPVVFDVGANVGAFTAFIKINVPRSKIYSFEPQKYLFDLMIESFKNTNDIYLFNTALGSVDGTSVLYKNHDFPYLGNSLYKVGDRSENISIRKLSNVLQEVGVRKIDLIKIDTEGSEYVIVKDLIENNVDFNMVCFEYHSDNIRKKIDRLLEKTHILVMFLCTVPNFGKAIYMDKQYAKESNYISENDVIGSYEL